LIKVKKKDLVPINGFYRVEFKTQFGQNSNGISFIGFLDLTAKTIIDDYLDSKENLDSNNFIFNLTIGTVEQFLTKLAFRSNIKMNVFGTNQNMRINQRIRKRLFNILERNNISKETIRYLQPLKKPELNRNYNYK